MDLIYNRKISDRNSESGFILIVALIAIMILLAIGYFALTVSTGDLRIASRLVGERKAFSAAESGVHALCTSFTGKNAAASGYIYVDTANDPTVRYSYTEPERNASMPSVSLPGFELTKSYSSSVWDTVVTGEDTTYGSKAQISVGTATAPNPTDTQQGPN